MTKVTNKREQGSTLNSVALRLTPIAAGCAILLSTATGSVFAQDAVVAKDAAPAIDTIVVTGIRRGIEAAISVKKNSSSIVEAISAEDIGKLPDTSIAESIARLPGLAAQRVAGRAQGISVRGLSPDFATTLLNGREQVSTGDNRGVEFDQYPSELLSGVVVYKTPDAGLVGQGLSGTIDMQLARPLDFAGRTVSLNARGERNSLGAIANQKATGQRFSASYIDQFANRTVGVALGFAHITSPILDNETGTYEPFSKDHRAGLTDGTWNTAGVKSLAKSGELERNGVIGVLDYRPSKEWRSTLDVFVSKFKQETTNNQFEVNLGGYNGSNNPLGFAYQSTNIVNGTLLGGTATGAYPLVRGQYDRRQDDIKTAGWANKFKFDKWSLLADVNYSQSKRDEFYVENNVQLGIPNVAPINDTLMTVGWTPGNFATIGGQLNYSDPTKLVSGNTIYGAGDTFIPRLKDTLKSFKMVATMPVPEALASVFSEVEMGLNVSDRTKTKRQEDGKLTAKGNLPISSDLLYAPVNLGFAGSGIVPSWNVPGVIAKYFNPLDYSEAQKNAQISRTWDVTEKVDTAFVKANIDSDLGSSMNLRGNVGAQVIRTNQSSASFFGFSGVKTPVNDGKVYTDVLPSVNLALGLADQQTVRFGVAKQVARPRLDQLNAGFDFSVAASTRLPSGNGGNAKLDPWRATALDISYEKYFGTKAYFAAAGFYKKLTSYIYNFSETRDFSQFLTPAAGAISPLGQYTAPRNGTGGGLKGAELTVSLPFSMITPVLDGFGVTASTTYTSSSINIQETNNTIGKITLPGLSKTVSNLTFYYEKHGFSTRISQRRRSDFVGEIGDFKGDRQLRYVVGENVTDLQVGYTFDSGSLKGLGLVLQVNNLTNTAYETYANSPDHQLEYAKYGRTMLFGANYKF